MRFFYLLFCALSLSSCIRPGDGYESGSDKREWSILQSLESKAKSKDKIEFIKAEEYTVIRLLAVDGKSSIWIMLDPKSPPFYKQMPSDMNYFISKIELDTIQKRGNPISTVIQALESHQEAEQDAAANP